MDSNFDDPHAMALQRLATLPRLREQAQAGQRAGMLESIEKLIEQERKTLTALDSDSEPA